MPRRPFARLFSRRPAPQAAARPRRLLEKLEDRRLFDAAIAGDADPDAAGPQHEPAPEAADTALVSHDGQRPTAEDPERRRSVGQADGAMTGDAAATRAGTPERAVRTEIVFLDPTVDDADRLLADLEAESDPDRDFEIVLLEGDGLAQIGAYLDGRTGIDAVHVLSHGDEGAVRLGDVWLTAENLEAAAGEVAGWGSALTADGDLLIYGCDLAGSAEGVELLDSLATLTGADVAASDDPTGHESRGGDWVLEYRNGEIQARGAISEAVQADWRHVLAVGPNVALDLPADVPIGQDFTFTATFSNTGAPGETGYGPFIDLLIPTNGTDGVGGATSGANRVDGLTVTGAKYLGADVTLTELVFPDDGAGTGTVFHPYAVDAAGDPLEITGNAGDTLIVLQLPFGSFAPEQPEAVIELTASVSDEADLGQALTVRARGGFQYGVDPLENPASDPSIVSDSQTDATAWSEAGAVTPSLMTLSKVYNGPENETATGPNHLRTYTITVDVADGQTITDLDVTDLLPDNLQFNRVVSVTGAGGAALGHTVAEAPPTTHPTSGGRVRVNVGSVTGGSGANDVTVVIEFHVPEFNADAYDAGGNLIANPEPHRVIPVSGEDDGAPSVIENNASALGDWTPIDDRDAGATDNASADPDPGGPEHVLDGKSIAVQKSVAVVSDPQGNGTTPGDVLEYTIRFQISDYFTFGDLTLDDLFSDGQRFDFGHGATFSVTDRGGTSAGNFDVGRVGSPEGTADDTAASNTLLVDESRIDFADNGAEDGASDGRTALTFDLSKALAELAGSSHADGILEGGRAVGADGAATGTITFRTVVQQDFADTFPSGDRSVDHGDSLSNQVDITGVARANGDHATLLATETDASAAGVSIVGGSFAKGVAFINGAAPVPGQTVRPGDTVTYELKYDLPSSDFEGLTFTDYLPQPVFDAADPNADGSAGPAWTFDAANQGVAPPSGTVRLGADDTFYSSKPGTSDYFDSADITVGSGNAVKFDFGSYDDTADPQTTIHLLFTVTVSDAPFADGLQLTNIARAEERNTSSDARSQDEIVQITLAEPDVQITKGAVSSDGGGNEVQRIVTEGAPSGANFRLTFDGQTTGDILFTADASAIQAELEGLANIGAGNVVVTGGPLLLAPGVVGTPYDIEFVGDLARTNVVQIVASDPLMDVYTLADGGVEFSDPVGPPGVVFKMPGLGGPPFTGTIDSAGLLAQPVDADIAGLDGGDSVKFAVVLENLGGADAYDLTVRDLLPDGFEIPAGGLNLSVQDGNGNTLTWTGLDGGTEADLFTLGIRVDDPVSGDGAANAKADADAAGNASNVVVVTYDLRVKDSVTADVSDDSLENLATLSNYAGVEGGRDHTTVDRQDAARAATRPFALEKRIVATSESHTGEVGGTERVTVGEIVRYRMMVEVPEGTHQNFQLKDLLPAGMTYLDDGTATVGFVSDGNLTSSGAHGLGTAPQQTGDETNAWSLRPAFALDDARVSSAGGPDRWNAGDDPTFDLGTLENRDDDGNREFVVVEFNAVAANAAGNDQGTNRAGAFEASADAVATTTSNSVAVRIAEPLVTVAQSRDKAEADAGDTVRFTLTLTADDAAARGTAFDVLLANALPPGLENLRNLSVTPSASGVTNAVGVINGTADGYTVTADAMEGGSTITVTFDADLTADVSPSDTIANHGDLTWTSLDGDYGEETADWAGSAATSSNLRTLDADAAAHDDDGARRTYATAPGAAEGERTGADHDHAAGTSSGVDDYGQRASASLSVPAAVYGKSLFATSDGHTSGANATVGELVTYALRVELPEGETTNLTITDLIPPGLDYESFTLVTTRAASQNDAGTFLLDADFNGTVLAPTVDATLNGDAAGDDVRFAFGTITVNPGDEAGAGNDGTFLLLVRTRVADVGTNAGKAAGSQTTLTNSAAFDTDGDGTAEATRNAGAVTVVEPDLTVTKSMTPGTGAEAGDTVTVSFTLENAGLADAFDLTIADDLADGLFENITEGTTPAGFAYSLSGDVVSYTGATLAAGDSVTFTFTAELTQAVGPNRTIANTATADYSTRAGDQGTDERDDSDSGSATLTTAPPQFAKVLFATDEAGTSGSDAAIGETVTYALVVDLPEGTTAGLSLADLLPDGLQYSGFRVVTTVTGSTPDGGAALLSADFDGTYGGATGTPLDAAAFTVSGGAADGADVTFSVGEIVMPADNDASANRFLLLVDAVVTDRVSNEGKLPGRTALVNTATLDVVGDADAAGDPIGPQSSGAVTVNVAEPDLLVTKTATVAANRDGGDTVSYTVTVAHTAASAADARDLVLTDLLTDADLSLVAGTVTTNLGAAVAAGNGVGDATLRVDLSRLEQGQTLTVTFDATLADGAAFGDEVSNTASATFDGLAGAGGRSETETDAETVTLDRPTIQKERVGTSVDSTDNAALDEAVVGELVTYRVTVTLPEGRADQATILDSLDANLEFDAVQSVTFGGDVTSTESTFAPTVTGNDLSFDFGTLTNPPGDAGGPQTVELVYTARVKNVAAVQGETPTVLDGTEARFRWNLNGSNTQTAADQAGDVTVLEPRLTVAVTATDPGGDAAGDAGEAVVYTIVVDHAGGANASQTDAFDVTFADPLPDGLTVTGFSVSHSTLGDVSDRFEHDAATNTLRTKTGQSVDLALAEDLTVTLNATVDEDAEAGETIAHTPAVQWTSLDGAPTGERTGAGGVNDYAASAAAPTFAVDRPAFVKSLVGTSVTDAANGNGATDAVIGELVTYRLEVTVPEGTTADAVIADTLDAGLGFVRVVSVEALSDGAATTAVSSDEDADGNSAAFLAADFAPTVTGDGTASDQALSFDLGTLTNADRDDAAAETFVILYEARVLNVASNDGTAVTPTSLGSTARLDYTAAGAAQNTADSSPTAVEVVEPVLTIDTEVDDDTPQLGQTVTYTLTLEHAPGSDATAHDLRVTDVLPDGVTLNAGSVQVNGVAVASAAGVLSDDTAGQTVDLTLDELAPGGTIEVTFTAVVTSDPNEIGTTFNDDADLTWTSLDGAGTGERTGGAGAVNDYADGDADPLTVKNPDLSVTITDGETDVAPGQSRTYLVTVTNSGGPNSADATGVSVDLPIDGDVYSLTGTDDDANVAVASDGTLTWTPTGALTPGSSVTLAVTVQAHDPARAGEENVTLTASATMDQIEPTPADTVRSDTDAVDAAPDLFATIDDGRASATTQDVLTYAITYGNAGDQHSTTAVLTVTPPPHTTVDAATAALWTDEGDGTWTLAVGDLDAAGASNGSTSFTVRVDDTVPSTADELTATVAIADDGNSGPDANAADDDDSDVDVLSTAPDYFVTTADDVADGDAVLPGETLTYTLAYGNKPNLQDGTGVVLTHTVPAGTSYDPANDARGWTFRETNGDGLAVYEKTVGPLSSGANGTATFSVIVDDTADALREQIVAAATIEDDGTNGDDPAPADNAESETTPLTARVDLAVTVDDGDAGLVPGQTLDLTVGYDNLGDQDAADATLTLTPPAGTTVSAADRAVNELRGWGESGGVWTNSLGNLPADDPAGSVLFRVTVDDPVTAGRETIDSTVTIADAGTAEPDLTPADNAAADSDPLTAAPDLTLSVTPDKTDAEVGETVTYTLDFANVGDQHAGGTTLTFVVPPGTVGAPGNAADGWVDQGGGVWTLDLDQVDAGSSDSITFATTVADPVIADREEEDATATLADDGAGTPLTGPVTDQVITALGFDAVPDLVVDTTDHDLDAYAGEILEYTVTVSNVGTQTADAVRVVHTIPEGTTLSDDAIAGGWVDRGDGFAVLEVGAVTPGTPATVPFSVLVDSRQPALREQFDATATVADVASPGNPAEADPTPSNNVEAEPTPLDAAPDYVVTVTDRLDAAKPGETISWTITLRNVGGQDGTGVVLTDEFPPDLLTNVRATSGGVVNASAGTIRWDFAELAGDGGTIVLKVTGTIPEDLESGDHDLTHRVAVTDDGANGADPTPANNRGRDVTSVTAAPAFAFDSLNSPLNDAGGSGGFGAFGGGFEGGFGATTAATARNGGDRYATDSPGKPLGGLLPTRRPFSSLIPRASVDPMFSGTAEPGTLLSARVYDADGRVVAERQVLADTAGNWLMSFPGTVFYEQPQRMEFSRTAAVGATGPGVNGADAQFALRRFFHPVTHATLFFTENSTVGGALGGAAGQRLDAAHQANRNPLGTGTQVRPWMLAASSATAGQA
ncbi:isopeptide-forming domain-containing fimbrial protein [Alienimonas chondri]|uniref:DUF4347 domain-containing protein n=1 Tax=Alienimonas chondri TaxID=2681879 RepID=A0ABX1VGH9_9PLAN|nr:isopeptide-forming domain-containing fimbrial protein [Alienimonas chondri]NNJ26985.1 hypothetical protein [Alienimonas chondri]